MSSIGKQGSGERKKSETRIAKMDKILGSKDLSKALRDMHEKTITEMTRLIDATRLYSPDTKRRLAGRTDESRREAIQELSRLNARTDYLVKTNTAANKMFQDQARLAKAGELSIYTKEEINIIYSVTKSVWSGSSVESRNKEIMDSFGVYNMQIIAEGILQDYYAKKNKKMQEYANRGYSPEEAEIQWMIDTQDSQKKDSPPYLAVTPQNIEFADVEKLIELVAQRNE